MHEYSIISSLIDMCFQHLQENNAKKVIEITISVGERSNIDKNLLISAFEVLKSEYNELSCTKIAIITENLLLECNDCKHTFHSLDNPICPKCDKKNTTIIKGRDIKLERIELEA